MTEGYNVIAGVYDRLNAEIDYSRWADFIEKCFDKYLAARPELLLDLACGTGSMTKELALRGYDMIGVDGSADMLAVAAERAYIGGSDDVDDLGDRLPILYLLQDMRSFELYGTVGAVVCCLDSVNYLTEREDVKKCFSLVHNYLDPDGVFIFDINSPYKFKNIYGDNAYVLEDEDDGGAVFCAWQNRFDAESGICDFYLTLFSEEEDGRYSRSEETQRERMYTLSDMEDMLCETGFEVLGAFGGYDFEEIDETTERFYIAARAKK